VEVKLRDIVNDTMPSTVLASAYMVTDDITTDTVGEWETVVFGEKLRLIEDSLYFIQIGVDTADASNKIHWRSTDWSAYEAGVNMTSDDGGTTWSVQSAEGFLFDLIGTPRGDQTSYADLTPPPIIPSEDTADWDDFYIELFNDFEDNTPGSYAPGGNGEFEEDWAPFDKYNQTDVSIKDTTLDGRDSRVIIGETDGNETYLFAWWSDLSTQYDEIYLSFSVLFRESFDGDKGGKIMGLNANPFADGGDDLLFDMGYNGALMWKGSPYETSIRFYTYHHDQGFEEPNYTVSDNPYEDGPYGDLYPWNQHSDSSFATNPEFWLDVTYRAVMNTTNNYPSEAGDNNAILELFHGKTFVNQRSNLRLRNDPDLGTDMIKVQCFFGGGGSTPQRYEFVLLDNVVVWTYTDEYLQNNPNVPRGNEPWDQDTIYTPFDVLFPDEY
jgi:hypothetical protein